MGIIFLIVVLEYKEYFSIINLAHITKHG